MSLIRFATRTHFAVRVLEDALAEELRAREIRAPLIVVDDDGMACLPLVCDYLPVRVVPQVLQLDHASSATRLTELIAPGPNRSNDYDALIGLGGKAALDFVRLPHRQVSQAKGRAADCPIFVIPTLPGSVGLSPTASAISSGAHYRAQQLVPDVVFCDPSLLHLAPPRKLALAGMDTVVHCLEALLSDAWNPPADAMAYDGLWRSGRWLERLVSDPQDAEASREVLAAALNGELASQKGAGALHALAHAFERTSKTLREHGLFHGALIAAVVEFNAPAVPRQMIRAAEALRIPEAQELGTWLSDLAARLGLPQSLSKLSMTPLEIQTLADHAASDYANRDNPRLATSADYAAMIEAAM